MDSFAQTRIHHLRGVNMKDNRVTRWFGPLLVASASLLSASCVSAQADIPEIEVTRQNLTFQGVPASTPTEVPAGLTEEQRAALGLPAPGEPIHLPTLSFTYSRVAVDLPTGLSSRMHVREVTVRASSESTSLAFIKKLQLTAARRETPDVVQTVLEYPPVGSTATAPLEHEVTIPVQGDLGTIDPWKPDTVTYYLDVWADLATVPRSAWAVDVILQLDGSVKFEF
jgi:hypothetical protein